MLGCGEFRCRYDCCISGRLCITNGTGFDVLLTNIVCYLLLEELCFGKCLLWGVSPVVGKYIGELLNCYPLRGIDVNGDRCLRHDTPKFLG